MPFKTADSTLILNFFPDCKVQYCTRGGLSAKLDNKSGLAH